MSVNVMCLILSEGTKKKKKI